MLSRLPTFHGRARLREVWSSTFRVAQFSMRPRLPFLSWGVQIVLSRQLQHQHLFRSLLPNHRRGHRHSSCCCCLCSCVGFPAVASLRHGMASSLEGNDDLGSASPASVAWSSFSSGIAEVASPATAWKREQSSCLAFFPPRFLVESVLGCLVPADPTGRFGKDGAHASVRAEVGAPATDSTVSTAVIRCTRVGSEGKAGCVSFRSAAGEGGWFCILPECRGRWRMLSSRGSASHIH